MFKLKRNSLTNIFAVLEKRGSQSTPQTKGSVERIPLSPSLCHYLLAIFQATSVHTGRRRRVPVFSCLHNVEPTMLLGCRYCGHCHCNSRAAMIDNATRLPTGERVLPI